MKQNDATAPLARDAFAQQVLQRHGGSCAFCSASAVDAHHILDRKLFKDGGYMLGNGAAVCARHHWHCETTEISADQARAASGITVTLLPDGFRADRCYDKWGNCMVDSGVWAGYRIAGPLMSDTGARRALAKGGFLHLVLSKDVLPQGEQS